MNPASDWIGQARELFDMVKTGIAASADAPGDAAGRHSDDCRWCPVCQAAAVVRGERPEVTAALADVLTAAAATLRSFADADRPSDPGTADGTAGPTPEQTPVVQRIEIA
jgi:hypothetical protein